MKREILTQARTKDGTTYRMVKSLKWNRWYYTFDNWRTQATSRSEAFRLARDNGTLGKPL